MATDQSLREPHASIFRILFDWFNKDESGELLDSDFKYFQTNHGFSVAVIRSALITLTDKGYLSYKRRQRLNSPFRPIDPFASADEEFWVLGEAALEFAHSSGLLSTKTPSPPLPSIPASNRFVSINHNTIEIEQTLEALNKLDERLLTSNELSVSPEERNALSKEVRAFRDALQQQVVRVDQVWNAVKGNGIIVALMTHTSDAMLVAIAEQIVGHLTKTFGWS